MRYYDHTFRPWRVRDDAIYVASVETWCKPPRMDKAAEDVALEREVEYWREWSCPRVLCEPPADVFGAVADCQLVFTGNELTRHRDFRKCILGWERASFFDIRNYLLRLIDRTPHLAWIVPTEYPASVPGVLPDWVTEAPPIGRARLRQISNFWLGVTVRTQADAERLIPPLLRHCAYAGKLFVRARPVEELALRRWLCDAEEQYQSRGRPVGIDWLIVEGDKEPVHPDWVRSLRDQCQAAGVPFWFEGWGEWAVGVKTQSDRECGASQFWPGCYHDFGDDWMALKVGKKRAGRLLDGREWNEAPR